MIPTDLYSPVRKDRSRRVIWVQIPKDQTIYADCKILWDYASEASMLPSCCASFDNNSWL